MPPKKGKKKKSKAEIEAERKAQEEEELRRKEEEERQEAERLAKQREEEERALARRIEARNDEVDRFIRHKEESSVAMSTRTAHLRLLQEDQRKVADWNVHVGCNEEEWPDADAISLNSYISELDDNLAFQAGDVVKCINIIGRVIAELGCRFLERRGVGGGRQNVKASLLSEFSLRLQMVLMSKIDFVTSRILEYHRNSTEPAASDSFGVHFDEEKNGLALYLNETDSLDLRSIGVVFDIPGELRNDSDHALRVCRFPFEPSPHLRFTHGDLTIGGVFHIGMMRRPPPDKAVSGAGWTFRTRAEKEPKDEEFNFSTPIRCCVHLPANIIMDSLAASSLLVAKWSMAEERWSTADMTDLSCDEGNRTVSFKMGTSGIVGVLQTRQIDLDYNAWSLGPIINSDGEAIVEFKLLTPRFEVVIHVSGCQGVCNCTLIAPDVQELTDIRGTPQTLGKLLTRLSCSGLHILPSDSDACKMERALKKREIEKRAHSDISYLSTAFDIKSSRFNSLLRSGQACYLIRESDSFTGGCDPSPMVTALVEIDSESESAKNAPGANDVPAHCGSVRCSIIKGDEDKSEVTSAEAHFNVAEKVGTESSLFMSQCIAPLSSQEAMERVKTSSPLVSETVKQILELTRPVTFCR